MSMTKANPEIAETSDHDKAMKAADRLARILKDLGHTAPARLLYVSQVFASSGLLSRREAAMAFDKSRGPRTE